MRLESEEEECARVALSPPPALLAPAQPAPDMNIVWNTAFPWAGPAPTLIDLTGPDAADEGAQGSDFFNV
ncbi:hypothetical protein D1007_42077 [Hordeum vulgare]|nr:hypothetical protein D1007_42077 [Hordeum vulgare]